MGFLADLHIHSRFANATSPQLNLGNIARWGKLKGIDVIGTGDFTHPVWLNEIQEQLEFDQKNWLYRSKESDIHFALTSEVALFYTDKGKAKRIHLLVIAPDIPTVFQLNNAFAKYGNLASDGRPVLTISADRFVALVASISPACEVIPAHIWTPWFGVLGKRFGYDDLESCFKDQIEYVHAIETGLSSDPYMNWLALPDNITIASFSDAHSLERIGREATCFATACTFPGIIDGLRNNALDYTIEFFPEEGKYHYSGHRKCHYRAAPDEAEQLEGRCPVCHRKMTEGVFSRVMQLSELHKGSQAIESIEKTTRHEPDGFIRQDAHHPFVRLVPLDEVIARTLHVKNTKAKKVQEVYQQIIPAYGKELDILIKPGSIKNAFPEISRNIKKVLSGKIKIEPGYDNTYGHISFV